MTRQGDTRDRARYRRVSFRGGNVPRLYDTCKSPCPARRTGLPVPWAQMGREKANLGRCCAAGCGGPVLGRGVFARYRRRHPGSGRAHPDVRRAIRGVSQMYLSCTQNAR